MLVLSELINGNDGMDEIIETEILYLSLAIRKHYISNAKILWKFGMGIAGSVLTVAAVCRKALPQFMASSADWLVCDWTI
jgi:hypothetical protein